MWKLENIFICQVNKRCRFLLEFEKILKHELENLKPDDHPFSGQDVDSSALGWAMSAVSSRAFRLYGGKRPDGTRSNVPMMLPLIDMCNHSFDPNAEIVQEEANTNRNMLVKVFNFLGSVQCSCISRILVDVVVFASSFTVFPLIGGCRKGDKAK